MGDLVNSCVISVTQQKGGSGKTTLACHVAVEFMHRGYRVALLDIDPQGSLSQWHMIREQRFGEGYTGFYFNALSGWRVSSEITRLRRTHDIIIVDSPPHVETEARAAIRSADLILVPVQPSPTDLWATRATLELARAERVPFKIVMNRVNHQSRIVEAIRNEITGQARSMLGNRVAFATSIMEGLGVTEYDPASPASQEIQVLSEELLNLMKFARVRSDDAIEGAGNSKTAQVIEMPVA